MKLKSRIISVIAIITLLVMGITVAGLTTAASDLSALKGTGSSQIGKVFKLRYTNNLKGNTGAYCIQKDKNFEYENDYVLKYYVQINGKQATVYDSGSSTGGVVVNDLNAQVAYILSKQQGYGTHENPTEAQQALWYITNDWTTALFGNTNYTWSQNATAKKQTLNDEAVAYANSIGNQLATTENANTSSAEIVSITDKTDKSQLNVMVTDGYYRVGPFRWEFDGALQSITVTGNNGSIPDSNVRFVKYAGTTSNVVNPSEISTGEAFYVDISQGAGVSQLKGLTLRTNAGGSSSSENTVYTADIWFFQSSKTQNLIYVDVGNSPGTSDGTSDGIGNGEYDVQLSTSIGITKVDDRDQSIPLVGVGFTFKTTIQTYDAVSSEDHYKEVSCTHVKTSAYTDEKGVYHPATYEHDKDIVLDWTQYKYEWKDHTMYLNGDNTWSETPYTFYTNDAGSISITNIKYPTKEIKNESYNGQSYTSTAKMKDGAEIIATEVSNPYYGYTIGHEYTVSINTNNQLVNNKITNHQSMVKLSGFVWLDENDGKTDLRNDKYDADSENGFNGITVYLRDLNGNEVKRTTTSELGLYSEIDGGEYQFVDVDLDKLQAGDYYVEFEYCGITYQSVGRTFDNSGSKAIDTETRNELDSKFTSVNATGTQSLNINDVTVNYNDVSNHVSTVNSHTGCNVYARTNETDDVNKVAYDLYSGFTPTAEEIRYVNLGLFIKPQTDYALSQDLYDVRVDVNGFSHVYRYATVRYGNNGTTIDEDSSWNMGVKFQKNTGTYARAIYNADSEYKASNHQDNEIKVYVTYKIALRNESSYLGRINSIVDYCDNRYELVGAGTSIDDKDNITGNVNVGTKTTYNNEYSKYTIDVNSTLNPGETSYIYVQFRMDRSAILTILNNGELLNNVAEINSYTTFKDNNVNRPVSVIDTDSLIGNAIPGNIETYEDDTDAARSLQLELKNARVITGTVFVDSTGKDSNIVYENQERLGNGIFDNGESTISGITVKLRETGKDDSSYDGERIEMETTTDENGNFEFVGYIPGNYIITYTWGDKTYKVQYYKGTIYDESRDQNNQFWYKDDVSTRKTDALDDSDIRTKIDDEMERLKYNTLENEINKAYEGGSSYITQTKMNSSTPVMSFGVEYETTITDGTVDQVRFTVENVDFGIVERAKQKLELSKRVSGFKITLANGQILVDAKITEDGRLEGLHDYTTYIGPTNTNGINSNGFIRTEIDNELIEGATIEITYTMKVTNIGELDYVSEAYYYYGNKTNSDVVRVSVTQLLDYVDGRLSVVDDKWEEKDENFLNEVNASQKDNEAYINSTRTYITSQLSRELAPGESNTVDLYTSKLLTSTEDNTFDNKSEIVEVTKTNAFNTGTPVKVEWNEDQFYFNVDNSETIIIIPSTGEDKSYVLPIIIGMTSLLVLGIGIFVIKKFIIDNK